MANKYGNAGLAARNTGSVFEALQDALKVYLHQKDQQQSDKWKERELARQDAGQQALDKYYQAQIGNWEADNRRKDEEDQRKSIMLMTDRYGGRTLPSTDPMISQAEKLGMGSAFEDQMTLPAKRLDQSLGQMPAGGGDTGGGSPQYFTPAPQAATGMKTIVPTEDSKLRAEQMRQSAQDARNTASIAGRQTAVDTQVGARRDIASQNLLARQLMDAAHNKLTQMGINNLEAYREKELQEHIAEFVVRASDMEIRDRFRDPTMFFKSLGDSLDAAPPKLAPFNPPKVGGPKPALAPTPASKRFTIIEEGK